MKKTGITGATGQLGRLVTAELKKKIAAEQIVALVRTPANAADLNVETRKFDYNDATSLESSLHGIDTLMLISANEVGKRKPQHENVINAAKKAGVKWIVYTSLLDADKTSLSLAAEHVETEKMLKASGIPYTILRNGWYTENYGNAIAGATESGVIVGSAGDGKISAATRQDYAEAAVAVLSGKDHQGNVYELAGDEAFTMTELAAEVSRQLGKGVVYRNMPAMEYAGILKSMGLPEPAANMITGWDVGAAKGDLFNDGKVLSKLIGRPTTPLADAVKAILGSVPVDSGQKV